MEVRIVEIYGIPRSGPRREGTNSFNIDQGIALLAEIRDRIAKNIEELKASVIFADDAVDQLLVQHPDLPATLREAIGPLRTSFGPDKVFRLEISTDEVGSKLLYGIALWNADCRPCAGAVLRKLVARSHDH
jgi:hypothetical protein